MDCSSITEAHIFTNCCLLLHLWRLLAPRAVTGSRKHQFWEPELDPPGLLSGVSVVLLSPRRPSSVGTVSRACSCFEVDDVRIVQPRCDYITRWVGEGSMDMGT